MVTSPETTVSVPSHTSADQQAQGLPSYIRPLPARLNAIDIEYLTKKGALTLPDEKVQVELIRKYLEYVYPFMPILDVPAFLAPIARRDGSPPVSLLLFQSVMFAGSAFADTEYIITRGYPDRRSMRREFFERARLLYDQDCEPDRVSLLQALLLMTFWYEKADDEKETWYWTGVALSLAQVMGMHRNPDYLDISPTMKCLRKRIWWSCFVRDRLLAIGIRRPARIRAEDFDVPVLTLGDFEMEPLENDILRYLVPLPLSDDSPTKTTLGLCFIELTRLCVHIGDILSTQYSVLGNPARGAEENITMMVMPRRSAKQMQEMATCDRNLEDWLQNLNPECRYNNSHKEKSPSQRVLQLHQSLLHMIYLTAMVILHRPQALRARSIVSESGVDCNVSRKNVSKAAASITEIVYDLQQRNQLCFASTSAIPAILSATLIHLIDIRYSEEEIRYTCIGRFYQCWQSLQYLRDIYASVDHGMWFLEAVIQKTNIRIPMLNLTSLPTNSKSSFKSGMSPSQSMFANTSMNSQRLEHMSHLDAASHSLMSPLTFGNAPTDAINFPPGAMGPLTQSDMGDPNTVDLDEEWSRIHAEENLLQALVNFDANPNFFAVSNIVPM